MNRYLPIIAIAASMSAGVAVASTDGLGARDVVRNAPLLYQPQSADTEGMTARQKAALDYVKKKVEPWIESKTIVDGIEARNAEMDKLSQVQLDQDDINWLNRSDKKLLHSRLDNAVSKFLKKKKGLGAADLEIFVMDNNGFNVGETDLTHDMNQGDEAKYWYTYKAGPDAVFVDSVGPDGGRPHICQISLTIKDPATGKAIGAMTVGVDTDHLKVE